MRRRGFTLIEVLIAMIVLATAALSVLGVYGNLAALRETGRNMNQAMLDARAVLESMRESAASGLTTVTSNNWTQWASTNKLTSLPQEAITVSYANVNADPLNVTVQVAWTERRRPRTATLQSFITQR